MDVLQIILVVFMIGALGAVVIDVNAMAINGKLNKNNRNKLCVYEFYFRQLLFLFS